MENHASIMALDHANQHNGVNHIVAHYNPLCKIKKKKGTVLGHIRALFLLSIDFAVKTRTARIQVVTETL